MTLLPWAFNHSSSSLGSQNSSPHLHQALACATTISPSGLLNTTVAIRWTAVTYFNVIRLLEATQLLTHKSNNHIRQTKSWSQNILSFSPAQIPIYIYSKSFHFTSPLESPQDPEHLFSCSEGHRTGADPWTCWTRLYPTLTHSSSKCHRFGTRQALQMFPALTTRSYWALPKDKDGHNRASHQALLHLHPPQSKHFSAKGDFWWQKLFLASPAMQSCSTGESCLSSLFRDCSALMGMNTQVFLVMRVPPRALHTFNCWVMLPVPFQC